jgi:hypothetical protein
MATHQVTLALPETVYQSVEQTAMAVHRPIETVLVEALTATFPPISDLPEQIADEVSEFTGIADDMLQNIATEMLSPSQQQQLTRLLGKNSDDKLTKTEKATLERLMDEYWRITLRKAQARAILAQRACARKPKD